MTDDSKTIAVKYSDQSTTVNLGDRVEVRVWFRKRQGRVVYVPGISELNEELEYNGLRCVGIRMDTSALLATPVLRKTRSLKKRFRFIVRDASPCKFITPESREFNDRGSGVAL